MGKRIGVTGVVVGVLLLCWSGLQADNVLDTQLKSAHDIVATRKFVMKLFVENLQDMGKKLSGPNAADGSVNAGSIQAFAEVLPPLFRAEYKEAYADFKESRSFFKGAPASGIEAQAEKLRSAALSLRRQFQGSDPTQAQKGMGALQDACKGCHALYRGKR